jgi:hypothetical protein
MKFKTRVLFLTLFVFLVTNSVTFAGMFGPLSSTSKPGRISMGAGYTYISENWSLDDIGGDSPQTSQHQLFAQVEMGLVKNWRVYARGGLADWKVENAFRFSNEDSNGGFLPFGTAGISGPVFTNRYVEIGPFVQGSYFSLYDDSKPISVTAGTGTEKVYFDNAWEINAGLAFQSQMEGAYLYGGPFYFMGKSKYRSVAQAGGTTDVQNSDMEEENNVGAYLGVRWPFENGLSLEVEAQYRSDVSVGTLVNYTF